jgi:post-segregation antitoxin (ccd killing protein)
MNYLSRAIQSLRPGAEFSFQDEDYSTIQWNVLEGKAPTAAAINAEIERLKAEDAEFEANKATAKAALLERLGLTEAEVRLLLA